MHSTHNVPTQHLSVIEVWTVTSKTTVIFQSFNRWYVGVFGIIVLLHDLVSTKLSFGQMALNLPLEYSSIKRNSWLTQWLEGAQVFWLQNKLKSSPPTIMLDGWYETWHCELWPNYDHLHFCFICSKDIAPETSGFVLMQLCKHKACWHVSLGKKGLSPGYPSKKATFFLWSYCHKV